MNNHTLLLETIGAVFEVAPESLTDASSPDTIPKWDSLRLVNLVAELEVVFRVQFDILEIADFQNLGIIKSILIEKGVPFD